MNVHDSERLAGLLEEAGYARAPRPSRADLVVFNTCAVRENADNKLYGNLGHLRPSKAANPGMQIAVGGCLAQKDRGDDRPAGARGSTSCSARTTSARCPCCSSGPGTTTRRRSRSSRRWRPSRRRCPRAATRPTRAGCRSRWAATTPARSASCPSLRGKEVDRRPGDILAEVAGAGRRGRARGDAARPERQLLRRRVRRPAARSASCCVPAGGIEGLERVRFTSPHPRGLHRRRHRRDGRDAERLPPAAHAAAVRLGPRAQGDAPLLPHASATSASSTRSAPRCRTRRSPPTSSSASPARPRRTSRTRSTWCAQARFSQRVHVPVLHAPRHARRRRCPTSCPRPSCRSATTGSSRCRTRSPRAANRELVGRDGRAARRRPVRAARTPQTRRMSGRARDGRLCTSRPGATARSAPGDVVDRPSITYGAPHHLVADGGVLTHRRTTRRRRSEAGHRPKTAAASGSACRRSARPRRRPPLSAGCGSRVSRRPRTCLGATAAPRSTRWSAPASQRIDPGTPRRSTIAVARRCALLVVAVLPWVGEPRWAGRSCSVDRTRASLPRLFACCAFGVRRGRLRASRCVDRAAGRLAWVARAGSCYRVGRRACWRSGRGRRPGDGSAAARASDWSSRAGHGDRAARCSGCGSRHRRPPS